eukprot:2043063-Amphidinium_carterae.1
MDKTLGVTNYIQIFQSLVQSFSVEVTFSNIGVELETAREICAWYTTWQLSSSASILSSCSILLQVGLARE